MINNKKKTNNSISLTKNQHKSTPMIPHNKKWLKAVEWRKMKKINMIYNYKLLNIYIKSFKNLKNTIVSYIYTNSLTSIFNIKNKSKLIKSLTNKSLINFESNNIFSRPPVLTGAQIKELKNEIPYKLKNKTNILFKKNIKTYISLKTTFNSKIAKLLITSNNYNFYNYNKISNSIKNNIYEFLYKSFIAMSSIISKPVYVITPNKIIIQFFYLNLNKKIINNNSKSIFLIKNNKNIKNICNILTRFFKKPIELDLIKLYYPYFNSNILVNLFGIYINKIQLRKILNKFISKVVKTKSSNNIKIKNNKYISELSGIKIKVAGRLMTQRVVPRKTIKIYSYGAISRAKTMFVETSRFTNKNKRGAFSITVSLGHNLNKTKLFPPL